MPISYLSRTYKANPYVLPLDMDLFGKVMSAKQQKFDLESERIQGEIDNFNSLDIMKAPIKEYANQKITNLINGVNGMGGMDLSDPNVSSQLENTVSGIYNDNVILNGIAGTKQIRSLMSGYNDFKTNPKQKGKYSVANETLDMENVQRWLGDGQLQSSYNGASSPTPYVDYKKADLDNLKGMKSNQYQTITQGNSTLVFDKVNHRYLNPQEVMDVAAGLRTPDERAQVKRDAVYFSKYQAGYTPSQLQQRYIEQNVIGLNSNYQQKMNQYATDLLAAANDDNAKQRIQTSINDLKNDYKSKLALFQTPEGLKKINDIYQSNPEEFMYNVYNNDYTTALGNRFAFNEESRDLVWNQGEMFNQRQKMELAKMQQNQDQFNATMNQRKEESKIDMADKGIVQRMNPLTGQPEYIKIGLTKGKGTTQGGFYDANGNLLPEIPQVSGDNTANPEQYRVDEGSIRNNIQSSIDSTDKVISNLVDNLKVLHPELNKQFSELWGTQSVMDIIDEYKLKGDPKKFDATDFQGFENDARIQAMVKQKLIDQSNIDAFAKMMKFANDASSNQGGTVRLPSSFQAAYEQLLPLQENIRYNKTILQDRENYIKSQLSPQEIKDYTNKDGSLNWDKINSGTITDWNKAKDITPFYIPDTKPNSNSDLRKKVEGFSNDYFTNKLSLRPEFAKRSFAGTDNEEQQKYYGNDLFNAISSYAQQRQQVDLNPNSVILRGYGKATDGSSGYELAYDYALPHKQGETTKYAHQVLKLDELPPATKNAILQRLQLDDANPFSFVDNVLPFVQSTSAFSYPTANPDKPFHLNSRIVNMDRNNPNSTNFQLQIGSPLPNVTNPNPENPEDYEWQDIKVGTKASVLADEAMRTIKNYKPSKFANDNNLLWDEFKFYANPDNRNKNFEQEYKNKH